MFGRIVSKTMTDGKSQIAEIVERLQRVLRYDTVRIFLGMFLLLMFLGFRLFWNISAEFTVIKSLGITGRHIFIAIILIIIGILLYCHMYIVRETYRNPKKDTPYDVNLGFYGRDELIALFEKQLPLSTFDDHCSFVSLIKQVDTDWRFFIFSLPEGSYDELRDQMNEYASRINEQTGFKLAPYRVKNTTGWSQKGCLLICNHLSEEIKVRFQQDVLNDILQAEPTVYFLADLDEGALYIPRLCSRSDVTVKYRPYVFALEKFAEYAPQNLMTPDQSSGVHAMKAGTQKYTTVRMIRNRVKLIRIRNWIWLLILPLGYILAEVWEKLNGTLPYSYGTVDMIAVYVFGAAIVIVMIIWLYAFFAARSSDFKNGNNLPHCIDMGSHRRKEDILADLDKIAALRQISEECFYGSVQTSERVDLRIFVLLLEDMYRKDGFEIADKYVREVNGLTQFEAPEHLYRSEGGYTMRVQIMVCDQLTDEQLKKAQIRAEADILEREPCVTFLIDQWKNAVFIPRLNPEKLTSLEMTPYYHAVEEVGSYLNLK